jgi:hypothetical protein
MFCQQCGAIVPEGVTFCDSCSQKLFPPPESAAPGDVFAGQGQPSPQQYAPPPPVSDYLQQQSHGYRYAAPAAADVRRRSAGNRGYAIAGVVATAISGLVVLLSTWLPWMSVDISSELITGNASASGWQFMIHGSQLPGGNFVWWNTSGIVFFSGLWSLLAGAGIIAGLVMLLLTGYRLGGRVAGAFGVLGVGIATVNLIMAFKWGAGNGIGTWLFLLFSAAAVIGGETAHRYWTDGSLFAR